jgi:hypothetical protein
MPTRDALREAYGLSMGEFIDGWREYVRENYTGKRTKPRDWFVR